MLHGGFSAAVGVRYSLWDHVSVRGGWHYGAQNALMPSFYSLGLGLHWAGFRLDAVWISGNEALNNTLSLGLSKTF